MRKISFFFFVLGLVFLMAASSITQENVGKVGEDLAASMFAITAVFAVMALFTLLVSEAGGHNRR